jgi:protocatechuate 3,4-dioxygenase beta subunit
MKRKWLIIGVLIVVTSILSFIVFTQAPQIAEENAPSSITIAAEEEPGERLIVTGRVFSHEGKTPLAGASVYVYHTDAKGLYAPWISNSRNPRLRGYMRTDAEGRYEFSSIKPAPYPSDRIAAHIHYVVNAEGYQERVFEIVFDGDPNIGERMRAEGAKEDGAVSIRALTRDQQGVWRCGQDIKMRKQ